MIARGKPMAFWQSLPTDQVILSCSVCTLETIWAFSNALSSRWSPQSY